MRAVLRFISRRIICICHRLRGLFIYAKLVCRIVNSPLIFRKPCQINNCLILNSYFIMTAEKILSDLIKKKYKPVYWLEGEEDFFIDEITDFAAGHILAESEASFNLTVFYGKDTDWPTLYNACRRYPMFAEKQVVIVKEAQDMRGIEKLESYVEKPLDSTILFVAYKGKK